MARVIPHILTTGGSIHLSYAPGINNGISTTNNISIRLEVDPPNVTPFGELTLEIPGEGSVFLFSDHTRFFTEEPCYVFHDDIRLVEFTIICTHPDPPSTMELRVHTRDKAARPGVVNTAITTYTVKKTTTTPANIRAAFISLRH